MKRRKFLIALGVVPPLVLSACKEKVIPATIIYGKVMDEKGSPIQNVLFTFNGYRFYSGSVAGGGKKEDIFKLEKYSDKDGNFTFSQVVPEITTTIYLSIMSPIHILDFKKVAKKNGTVIGTDSSTISVYPDYANSIDSLLLGQTNEYEITLTKK